MHQSLFRLGLRPRGAYITTPDLLVGFKGPTSKGREGRGGKGKGAEGKEREVRKCRVPPPTFEGYQSIRHTVKSSHGQLVTQSTRHSQLVTMLNYADGQLVTRATIMQHVRSMLCVLYFYSYLY